MGPSTPIPQEFNVVKKTDDGETNLPLRNLTPMIALPSALQKPALCAYASEEELGNAVMGWHANVHNTVGGTMSNPHKSPYAPIFWCFHAYLDDIYSEWQTCENPGTNRNFNFINFKVLSDNTKMPSGKVTENLFKEWSDWSKKHFSELK